MTDSLSQRLVDAAEQAIESVPFDSAYEVPQDPREVARAATVAVLAVLDKHLSKAVRESYELETAYSVIYADGLAQAAIELSEAAIALGDGNENQ